MMTCLCSCRGNARTHARRHPEPSMPGFDHLAVKGGRPAAFNALADTATHVSLPGLDRRMAASSASTWHAYDEARDQKKLDRAGGRCMHTPSAS